MFGKDIDDNKIWITRFIIDKNYQNKGLGGTALNLLINYIKNTLKSNEIYSSYVEDNKVSSYILKKRSFKPNGKVIDGNEKVLVLKFKVIQTI